jgi:porin
MLGDLAGLRPALGTIGLMLDLTETSEILGNISGGVKQGAEYDGVTTLGLSLDTRQAFGWNGGVFHVSGVNTHGRNLSAENLWSLQTASGIETDPTTRLWELWYEQSWQDGKFGIKIGQQSADNEFMTSANAGHFVNTVMGWPAIPSYDLLNGGPAFPLSALGVRVKAQLSDGVTFLGGIFNGDPVGTGDADHGTAFRLDDGMLAIGELQYAVNAPAQDGEPSSEGLPGTYKLGFWYNSEDFEDQRIDTAGLSLADPGSTGIAKTHKGNFSVYGLLDQMVWRANPTSPQSLNVFVRAMAAPSDQNLISFSINGDVTLTAPFEGRDADTFGIGFGYVQVSDRAAGLDKDTAFFSGTPYPVRTGETFVEITYQYEATRWLQLQPDFQYVFNPGGGLSDPGNPTQRIGDEAIIGPRANITL